MATKFAYLEDLVLYTIKTWSLSTSFADVEDKRHASGEKIASFCFGQLTYLRMMEKSNKNEKTA